MYRRILHSLFRCFAVVICSGMIVGGASAQPGPVAPLIPAFLESEVNPFGLTLVWSSDLLATSYQVQFVDTDGSVPDYANALVDETIADTLLAIGDWAFGGIYGWRVRALNADGAGPWTESGFFTLRGGPLQVQLVSPAEAAQDVAVDPAKLVWRMVGGAESYHLQIATTSNFSTIVVNAPVVQDTMFTTTALERDVIYHWRVKASNAAAANWSRTNLFFTGRLLPVAPSLLTPADGTVDQPIDVTLGWNALDGVFTYTLQVARDTAFADVVFTREGITATQAKADLLDYETVYYWRVQGVNDIGIGPWSAYRQFQTKKPPPAAVTLVAPSNGRDDLATALTLQWQSVPGAGAYRLEVGRDDRFLSLHTRADDLTDTLFEVSSLVPKTEYYWRVRATGETGTGAWSPVWRFQTAQQPPAAAVALNAPANGLNDLPRPVQLQWRRVPRAESYRAQVTTDPALQNVVQEFSLPDTLAQATLEPRTRYYWRVRGENEAGPGPWSAVWQFQTRALMLPTAPVLLAPTHGAKEVGVAPIFSWESVSEVDGYRLEVTTQPDFAVLALAVQLDTTHYQVEASTLDFSTLYYWRVAAFNAVGTAPSNPWSFDTGPMGVATEDEVPDVFTLQPNYPNPFATVTRITWTLPEAQPVRLVVYDVHGREVAVLADARLGAGHHAVEWRPAQLPSGVYLYRMQAGPYTAMGHMTKLQ